MCLFKKKKKIYEAENSKYKIGTMVQVRYQEYLTVARVVSSRNDEQGNVLYQLNVGGECPFMMHDVKEKDVLPTR